MVTLEQFLVLLKFQNQSLQKNKVWSLVNCLHMINFMLISVYFNNKYLLSHLFYKGCGKPTNSLLKVHSTPPFSILFSDYDNVTDHKPKLSVCYKCFRNSKDLNLITLCNEILNGYTAWLLLLYWSFWSSHRCLFWSCNCCWHFWTLNCCWLFWSGNCYCSINVVSIQFSFLHTFHREVVDCFNCI